MWSARAVLLLGALYLCAGILFGSLAGSATSHRVLVAWRLSAWVISAAAFAAHIAYEHIQLRHTPVRAASFVALAAGLGAFGLAVAARLHAEAASTPQAFRAFNLAVWPVMTAVPAFVVALALTLMLARARRRT